MHPLPSVVRFHVCWVVGHSFFVFWICVILLAQHGIFDWLGLRALHNADGISWLPPVMCFSIIVGLGLDYDVRTLAF